MKQKFSFKIFIFILFPFSTFCQQTDQCIIRGEMKGLQDGDLITLTLALENNKEQFVDSVRVNNGRFTISTRVPDGPRLYFLAFGQKYMRILIDNGQNITLRSRDITKIKHTDLESQMLVEGCPTHDALHYLIPVNTMYNQSVNRLYNVLKKINDSIGFSPDLVSGVMMARDEINEALYWNFFHDRQDSDFKPAPYTKVVPFMIVAAGNIDHYSGHASFLMLAYNRLNQDEKDSHYGKLLYESAKLSIGQPFPLFTLPNAEGKLLDLKNIINESKVTIVHFWADNSIDRKKYEDELRLLYKKYHDNGLNIVGFSSDKYVEEWKEALQKDQFPWYNVSDMKGADGMVEKVYHEFGDSQIHNTTNVLIDHQGKIIAWDVTDIQLKWYLWKAFDQEGAK